MASGNRIIVKHPPFLFRIYMAIGLIVVIVTINEFITGEPPYTATMIGMGVCMYLPLGIMMLWTKMYRVTVEGNRISFRRGLGLVRGSFQVSQITKVIREITNTASGTVEKTTLYVCGKKMLVVDSMALQADRFLAYICRNVDPAAIQIIRRDITKRNGLFRKK